MKRIFFLNCEFKQEGLTFELDQNPIMLRISLWKAFSIQYPFLKRLQLCWRILTKKEANLWNICFSEDEIKKLKKFLNNVTNH